MFKMYFDVNSWLDTNEQDLINEIEEEFNDN